jgi:hypothetical protein
MVLGTSGCAKNGSLATVAAVLWAIHLAPCVRVATGFLDPPANRLGIGKSFLNMLIRVPWSMRHGPTFTLRRVLTGVNNNRRRKHRAFCSRKKGYLLARIAFLPAIAVFSAVCGAGWVMRI